MKLRVKYTKDNYLRYISHLDLVRLFHRAFNRAEIPVSYSDGYNPRPKFSMAAPLSIGISSVSEYLDMDMERKIDEEEFKERMNRVLPKDVQILGAYYPKERNAIAYIISHASYDVDLLLKENIDKKKLIENIEDWSKKEDIYVTRTREHRRKIIEFQENIGEMIESIKLEDMENDKIRLDVFMETGSHGNVRPLDFIKILKRDLELDRYIDNLTMKRTAIYITNRDGEIVEPIKSVL